MREKGRVVFIEAYEWRKASMNTTVKDIGDIKGNISFYGYFDKCLFESNYSINVIM